MRALISFGIVMGVLTNCATPLVENKKYQLENEPILQKRMPASSQEVSCADNAEYFSRYKAIFDVSKGPWLSYPPKSMRWILVNSLGSGAVFYGFDPLEVASSTEHQVCDRDRLQIVFPTLMLKDPGDNWFYDCLPGRNCGEEILNQTVEKTKLPILIAITPIQMDKNTELRAQKIKYYREKPLIAASIWIHEIFHSFQDISFEHYHVPLTKMAKGIGSCINIEAWKRDLIAERNALRALLPKLRTIPLSELKKFYRNTFIRRSRGDQPVGILCGMLSDLRALPIMLKLKR